MIIPASPFTRPLEEYGICIPAPPDRGKRILKELQDDRAIASQQSRWLSPWQHDELSRDDLLRAHRETYIDRMFSDEVDQVIEEVFELRDASGAPYRYAPEKAVRPLVELRDNRIADAAGTLQCCAQALRGGFSFYLGGGAHHAHADFGHGFCLINDSVLALRKLQSERRIGRAWVIDVDAHKGDGTAAITAEDASIVTLSAHMARGWPLDADPIRQDGTPHPSFVPSDIDVPIAPGEDGRYLSRLGAALEELAKYDAPELALVLLGADPYEHDSLPSAGGLKLSLEQLAARDLMIYDFLESINVPQAYLMAGGYGPRAWEPYPAFLARVLPRRLGAEE